MCAVLAAANITLFFNFITNTVFWIGDCNPDESNRVTSFLVAMAYSCTWPAFCSRCCHDAVACLHFAINAVLAIMCVCLCVFVCVCLCVRAG